MSDNKEELHSDGATDLIVLDEGSLSIVESDRFYDSKDRALFLPKIVKKQISYHEYLNKTRKKVSKYGILPMNTRMVKNYPAAGNWTTLVVEEEPQMRTIRSVHRTKDEIASLKSTGYWDLYGLTGLEEKGNKYDCTDTRNYNIPNTFRLSFPFIVYLMVFKEDQFAGMNVFFRLSPISSMSDYLLLAPLHNIPDGQLICLGRWKDHLTKKPQSLFEEASAVIETFWNATFNNDYSSNYTKYNNNPELSSYFTWQYLSKQDPMFIFKTNWIQFNTLENQIRKFEDGFNLNLLSNDTNPFTFNKMWDLMMNKEYTTETKPVVNNPDSKVKDQRISNFINSVYIGQTSLSIGDDFVFNKVKYLVEDFLGYQYASNPSHILVSKMDSEEDFVELEYNEPLKKEIAKYLVEDRTKKSIEFSDTKETAKVGDIISYFDTRVSRNIYKKIENIRVGLDKNTHISFVGSQGHFLANNMKAKVMDMTKGLSLPDGTIIKEKGVYYTLSKDGSNISFTDATILRKLTVTKFDIISGNLGITFEQEYYGRNNSSLEGFEEQFGKIIDASYLEKLVEVKGPVIRLGSSIIRVPNSYMSKVYINPENLKLHIQYNNAGESCRNLNDIVISDDRNMEYEKVLLEDNKRLYIPGVDFDIDFRIGDTVFVGDWGRSTIDPFKLRTIESFVIDKANGYLSVITKDNAGNLLNTPYISKGRVIRAGLIRRAITEFEGVERGDVFKCKVKGFVDFPMVAKNVLLGIVTDSAAEPILVFANGCTLWYSDIRNFVKIDQTDVDEATFTVEQIKKFPASPGNMYFNHDRWSPYIVMEFVNSPAEIQTMNSNKSSRLKLMNHMNSSTLCSAGENDIKSYIKDPFGLPVPRLGGTEYVSKTLHLAVPSLHGGYIKVEKGRFGSRVQKFIN